jgi:hypothetical protein
MTRDPWGGFLRWMDGLSAFQAVAYFLLGCVPSAVLVAASGQSGASVVSYALIAVDLGLYILHCARRVHGGLDVFACAAGPGALAGILRSIFGAHNAANVIISVLAAALALLLAWSYDRHDSGRDIPAAAR